MKKMNERKKDKKRVTPCLVTRIELIEKNDSERKTAGEMERVKR